MIKNMHRQENMYIARKQLLFTEKSAKTNDYAV